MKGKVTEECFKTVKRYLNTPINYPSIRQAADYFDCSSATISAINKAKDFKEYKETQAEHARRYFSKFYDPFQGEREKVAKEIAEFNNEWYFKEDK